MAMLQQLMPAQIDESLESAAQKQIPLTVTVQSEDHWINLHSRALAWRDGALWIEYPTPEPGSGQHEFVPSQKVGVSFKLRHHKHLLHTTVASRGRLAIEGGEEVPALRLYAPTQMQRLQRRAFFRAGIPSNRIVRGSLWLGGRQSEPHGTSPTAPVWSGRVINISAGGFQLATKSPAVNSLEVGDTVGVRLAFGASSSETAYADAQFRHHERDGEWDILGFQFVGLSESPEGLVSLQLITVKVTEFQRIEQMNEGYSRGD